MVAMDLDFFSKTLVGYLFNDQFKTDILNMSSFDLKNKLKGIIEKKEDHEFKNGIKNFDEHFEVGYNKFSARISEKQEFIDSVCRHAIIGNSHEQTYQFKKGLELVGIMELCKKFIVKSFSGAYI